MRIFWVSWRRRVGRYSIVGLLASFWEGEGGLGWVVLVWACFFFIVFYREGEG